MLLMNLPRFKTSLDLPAFGTFRQQPNAALWRALHAEESTSCRLVAWSPRTLSEWRESLAIARGILLTAGDAGLTQKQKIHFEMALMEASGIRMERPVDVTAGYSLHEAAHVYSLSQAGCRLSRATIEPRRGTRGETIAGQVFASNAGASVAVMAGIFAGFIAMDIAEGVEPRRYAAFDAGQQDGEILNSLAYQVALMHGTQTVATVLDSAFRLAVETVKANWPRILDVQAALNLHKTLNEDQLDEILRLKN